MNKKQQPIAETLVASFPVAFEMLFVDNEIEETSETLGEKMYKNHYTKIHRYFSFRIFDKCEAEDLAQTVFLKIFRSLKSGLWEGAGDVAYIFTVARNTLIDHFRRGKFASIVSDDLVENFSDSIMSSDTMDHSEQREQREMLASAMKGMRKAEGEAVTLRFLSDMEYPMIAKIMKRKEDAVRQLVHRGLKSLRLVLQPLA